MNAVVPAEAREPSPSEKFRDQWTRQEREIAVALPPHIPVERFMRVVMTAVNGNADLLSADRVSLFEASMRAAQDGLLPDGRDGALVIFRAKVKSKNEKNEEKERWINKVQWMPMVGGILKKVRNSGELATIAAHVVYENDQFDYVLGDDERIEHKPKMLGERGKAIGVYGVAKTKDGGIYREVMSLAQVEKVRGVSRAKDSGPWKDWWDEMAKKTVIRRLAKRLPMSSDLDDLIRRDDDLYDFQGKRADLEGLHQQLAPTAMQRLEAARSSGGGLPAREGFNRSEGAGGTAPLPGEAARNDNFDADEDGQTSFLPDGDAGASSQAAGEDGSSEKADASTAPSSTIDPEAAKVLNEAKRDYQQRLIKILTNPEKLTPGDLVQTVHTARGYAAEEMPTEGKFVQRLAGWAEIVAKGADADGKALRMLKEAL